MISRILLVVAAATLAACNVVQVTGSTKKTKDGKEVVSLAPLPGLPFYVKHQQFRQVSVYRETWFRLTLDAETKPSDTNGAPAKLAADHQMFTAQVKKLDDPAVIQLKADVLRGCTNVARSREIISAFEKLPDRVDSADPSMVRLVRNDVESEWVVDDANPRYLNAKMPWFGAANLTQKLAADGTLTEVNSAPDTKLAEGLSMLIPFKEFLAGKYVKAAASATESDPMAFTKGKGPQVCLSLSIEETGYETTVKSTLRESADLAKALTIEDANANPPKAWITRKPIEEGGKPKDDAPTIGISGSIKLPKEKT